ncbi:MAG: hypothetical protein ACLSGS_00220 [Adlercreutzia sp.]
MTDTSAVYSTASATAGNPEPMADGTDRIGTVGWRLWREGVAAGARTPSTSTGRPRRRRIRHGNRSNTGRSR